MLSRKWKLSLPLDYFGLLIPLKQQTNTGLL